MIRNVLVGSLLLAASVAWADNPPVAERDADVAQETTPSENGATMLSGMSILGNQEAPKSLVIVPWKSSVLGDSLGIATMLDDSKQPIDREVFLRALSYFEIRSETQPSNALRSVVVHNQKQPKD